MNDKEKIEFIKENKVLAVAALNTYLDSIYDITDDFFDERGNRKSVLPPDSNAESFILETRATAEKFENVRQKLNLDDFNLSTLEINYIALAFLYVTISIGKQLEQIEKTYSQAKEVYNKLIAAEEKAEDLTLTTRSDIINIENKT